MASKPEDLYFSRKMVRKIRGKKEPIVVEVPNKYTQAQRKGMRGIKRIEERDPKSLNYLKKKYNTGTTKSKLQEANLMLQKRGKDISDILKKKKKEAEKQKGKEVVLPPEFYQLIKAIKPSALKPEDLPSTAQIKKEEAKAKKEAKAQRQREQPRRPYQGLREVEQVPLEEEDLAPIGERVARRRRQEAEPAPEPEPAPPPARPRRRYQGVREVRAVALDTDDELPIGRRAGRRQAPPRPPPPRQESEPETEIDNLLSAEENQDAIIQNPPYLDSLPDEQYLNALYNSTPDGLREYADRQGIDLTELPARIDKAELAEYIMYQKRGRVPLFNPGGNPGLAGEGLFKKRGRGRPRKHPIKGAGFLDTVVDLGKKAYDFVKENPDVIQKGIEYGKKGVEVAKKGIDYYKASRKAKGGALMMPARRGASTYQSYF